VAKGVTRLARITVRLTPRAGRDAIDGWDGERLRIRVAAAPVDGKANEALLHLLARTLGVAPSRLVLLSGARTRIKIVEIHGVSVKQARQALGV
jgi:uncharacterized protein (TIGR00251 family)